MLRFLGFLLVVAAVVIGGAYFAASRTAPPRITIDKPDRMVGQAGTLEVTAEAPRARLTRLDIAVEQNGKTVPLFTLAGAEKATVSQPDDQHLRVTRPFGKRDVPELRTGPARIVVTAARASFLNLRTVTATASRDIQVNLEPPRLAVLSTHHYVNHGGSEMVVYRATPPGVRSGVRVGDREYPGYPASGAGAAGDPSLMVAFFSLMWDQDLNTPIAAFARDEAGNESTITFVDNVFEKPFKRSRIEIDDRFIQRVVPEILQHSPDFAVDPADRRGDMVPAFVKINSGLRRINAEAIRRLATTKTSPDKLWTQPFMQLGNSKVEAAFADHRTYFYKGKEIDQQVHLGFDLAVTTHVPVLAANDGVVLNASYLGIYGNCVILDHGMGVSSLYGHMMSFDVKPGDHVARGQRLGLSDTTGLAGGDHVHFTMLVNGQMVNPVEWWDPHWIADRVDRKLQEAGAAGAAQSAAATGAAAR